MLAMGFADAMEAILSQTPAEKQVALFSATMAPNIRRIAQRHLKNPREVVIKGKTGTAANIKQSYWMVSGLHKLDALTRIVEVADFDAMLVFVRTKQSTVELAEKLQARGFAAVALNGDIQQSHAREDRGAAQGRQDRHPRRHRRGRARPGRGAHHACGELRRALRHRVLCAPHRAHRSRGSQRRGHPVHRAARAQPAATDRARHASDHRAAEPAERGRREHASPRQVQGAHRRSAGR